MNAFQTDSGLLIDTNTPQRCQMCVIMFNVSDMFTVVVFRTWWNSASIKQKQAQTHHLRFPYECNRAKAVKYRYHSSSSRQSTDEKQRSELCLQASILPRRQKTIDTHAFVMNMYQPEKFNKRSSWMNFDFIIYMVGTQHRLYVIPYSGSRQKCLQAWAFAAFNNTVNFTWWRRLGSISSPQFSIGPAVCWKTLV